jgi:pyruvate,water dikinase
MLWGVTTERLKAWGAAAGKVLKGSAGSPGIAEGKARVIRSADKVDQIQPGEILVCPVTAPAWGPIFSKVKGLVTDTGGVMAHAAIIAREYGIPAVVGTGSGTSTIKTGDLIRIDGSEGIVEILS